MDAKRLLALAVVAASFWIHVARRLWRGLVSLVTRRPAVDGALAFFLNYRPDNLRPLDRDDLMAIRRLNGCIRCGACERVQPGADRLVSSLSRSFPDYGAARTAAGSVAPDPPEGTGPVCPAGIDASTARHLIEKLDPGTIDRG